jgi:ATP-dependent DNA ligase
LPRPAAAGFRQAAVVDFPVDVALAELVPTLPVGTGWRYEICFDGHRTVVWRDADTVRLQARSGRDVTSVWMDLLAALDMLPPGLVVDGEAVIYVHGRIDFAATQSRALSTLARARRLVESLPAYFVTGVRTSSWADSRGAIGRSQQVGDPCSRRPSWV